MANAFCADGRSGAEAGWNFLRHRYFIVRVVFGYGKKLANIEFF